MKKLGLVGLSILGLIAANSSYACRKNSECPSGYCKSGTCVEARQIEDLNSQIADLVSQREQALKDVGADRDGDQVGDWDGGDWEGN